MSILDSEARTGEMSLHHGGYVSNRQHLPWVQRIEDHASWPILQRVPETITALIDVPDFTVRDLLTLEPGRVVVRPDADLGADPDQDWRGAYSVGGVRSGRRNTRASCGQAGMTCTSPGNGPGENPLYRAKRRNDRTGGESVMTESATDRQTPGKGLTARLSSMLQRLKQVVRERSRRGTPRRMVLLEALQLGNRRQLFLVACDEHCFLVGAGGDRVGTLVAIPETASGTAPGATSSEAVGRADGMRDAELGREPVGTRPSAFARTAGSRIELVRRDGVAANDATRRKGLEAGRTQ